MTKIFLLLALLPQLVFAKGLAIGESIDCKSLNDDKYGFVLTRTGNETSALISYGPTWRDPMEKAVPGIYGETKDEPKFIMAAGQMKTSNISGIYFEISINNTDKKDDMLRPGEALIGVGGLSYNEKGEVDDLMGMTLRLECGGKKVKRIPVAQCTRPAVGQAKCDIMYR
jgi:hypothetical protein